MNRLSCKLTLHVFISSWWHATNFIGEQGQNLWTRIFGTDNSCKHQVQLKAIWHAHYPITVLLRYDYGWVKWLCNENAKNASLMSNKYFFLLCFSSIHPQQCLPEYACVNFTVMDHDFMLANDFAGEAYVALNTVPGINGEGVSGFSMLRPIGLPLTQPRKMGGRWFVVE